MIRNVLFLVFSIVLASCSLPSYDSDYQAWMAGNYSTSLFILNGEAESLSVFTPSDDEVFINCQLVGHNGSSEAWPNDLLVDGDVMYVVNSGQNTIESYDAGNLDYQDKMYLKNGFNPLNLLLLDAPGRAVVTGFLDNEIVFVDLASMDNPVSTDFHDVFEGNSLSTTNATGDSHDRRPTGMAFSGDTLYVSNVRYDAVINYLDTDGSIIQYEGSNTQAPGYFREGTLSLFSLDADRAGGNLVREINLDAAYTGLTGTDYHPGNGLNPQSVFILNGKLHVVCTGTNGGEIRYYSNDEYLPDGYSVGMEVPGSNPDDGVILVMNLSDPENPVLESVHSTGGSPVGFRNSMDPVRGHLYLAGVGGLMAWDYMNEEVDRDYGNAILAGSDPVSDYYSHVLYRDDVIYVSDWTNDSLNRISVTGAAASPVYSYMGADLCGDGPGALAFYQE